MHVGASPRPLVPQRPAGHRAYEFTSTQSSPAGSHHARVGFELTTLADGSETAIITGYENADGDEALHRPMLSTACADSMRGTSDGIASIRITPPPSDLSRVLPACAPEDLAVAASDILPLFMVQSQPKFRARELRRVGDRLRFAGYDTRWRVPPTLLDQRITADSGTVSLDSANAASLFVTWDTSPMQVTVVRAVARGQRALLHGREWFAAQLQIDARTGDLVHAATIEDSLRLRMRLGYTADTIPGAIADTTGMLIRITRRLELRSAPRH
jgi:hypothetical protein